MTPEQRIDAALDSVLKASGSALRHYTMPKTLADMREAMRKAMSDEYIRGLNESISKRRPPGDRDQWQWMNDLYDAADAIERAPRWRDVADELPQEAQEVLFVRGGKTVHGAWIGGIFWHSNQKMAAAYWMPLPLPPNYEVTGPLQRVRVDAPVGRREMRMDWRETMQRMLVRMEEAGQWPAVCEEARAVLEAENEPSREPAAYLWGGCLWRTDEMERGRPGAVELYRAQTPMTDAEIAALLPTWQRGSWTLPDYGRWVARAVERAHGIKTSHNLCLSCGHSIDAHDRQYGCAEDGCDCETPNAKVSGRRAGACPCDGS